MMKNKKQLDEALKQEEMAMDILRDFLNKRLRTDLGDQDMLLATFYTYVCGELGYRKTQEIFEWCQNLTGFKKEKKTKVPVMQKPPPPPPKKNCIKYTLINGDCTVEFDGSLSPTGMRNGDKRPNKVKIEVNEEFDLVGLKKHIDYLVTLSCAMEVDG